MTLPLHRPYPPMEALSVDAIPSGPGWLYEPKWDGFRCIAFKDGDRVELQSKAGKSLTRYFPDVVSLFQSLGARRCVLDGEIVVPVEGELSFDELLLRIHPAASRVALLAAQSPATFIAFDMLVDDTGKSLVDQPLSKRRPALEKFAARYVSAGSRIRLSPATRRMATARHWFRTAGGGLDGILAKRLDCPYLSGERTGMQKVKRLRTADCVVGGFRYASKRRIVGSLLLGLYDDDGLLHHVGFTSTLSAVERAALTPKLERLRKPPGFTGQAPGGPSRWSTERSGQWEPLAPKLVVEVRYDHFTGGRFRHGTRFLRWRPDKDAKQCTVDQVMPGKMGRVVRMSAAERSAAMPKPAKRVVRRRARARSIASSARHP